MTLLDAAGPAEVFSEADNGRHCYDVRMVALGAGSVRTSSGVRIEADAVTDGTGFDTFLVPGFEGPPARDPALVAAVRALSEASGRVASVCTGSFLLAEAGLLEGRAATTHWRYADLMRRTYPAVDVQSDAIFVRAGKVFTSAGVSAGIDLALALVEDDHGADAARDVARSWSCSCSAREHIHSSPEGWNYPSCLVGRFVQYLMLLSVIPPATTPCRQWPAEPRSRRGTLPACSGRSWA
ncbi:AraC family transcriptional regulator [Actinoplanes sp. N902-109]|uniref:AraC family transcriptional regulator n=1 Tax=Actinoplanes sp. (strain N902-109) TaxID=649831 RepID=UPI0018DE80A5|nr:AraC family transcriptional regulator [Actinoplanes sp. N902-109]